MILRLYSDYKDLTGDTENIINNLRLLEVDKFDHNFDNIKDFEFERQKYNDTKVGSNLHKLKRRFYRNIYSRY